MVLLLGAEGKVDAILAADHIGLPTTLLQISPSIARVVTRGVAVLLRDLKEFNFCAQVIPHVIAVLEKFNNAAILRRHKFC